MRSTRGSLITAGLFDMFKENEEQRLEKERIKDEQLAAMKKMQELRRNPEAWEAEISKRRKQEAALRMAKASGESIVMPEEAVTDLPEGWSAVVGADTQGLEYLSRMPSYFLWRQACLICMCWRCLILPRAPAALRCKLRRDLLLEQGERRDAVGATLTARLFMILENCCYRS